MTLIRSGATSDRITGRTVDARSGQIIIIAAGTPHECRPLDNRSLSYTLFLVPPTANPVVDGVLADGRIPDSSWSSARFAPAERAGRASTSSPESPRWINTASFALSRPSTASHPTPTSSTRGSTRRGLSSSWTRSSRSGTVHPGITAVPLPVLAASSSNLAELKEAAGSTAGAAYIAFSDIAQRSKNYEEYTRAMRTAAPESLQYVGLCIYGEDGAVRSLTGTLRLLGS